MTDIYELCSYLCEINKVNMILYWVNKLSENIFDWKRIICWCRM